MPVIVWEPVTLPKPRRHSAVPQLAAQWRRGRFTIMQWAKSAGGHYSAIAELGGGYIVFVGKSRSLASLKLMCLKYGRARGWL